MFMDKTVCELFAGVGGFRCGLNHITSSAEKQKEKTSKPLWFQGFSWWRIAGSNR